MNVTEDDVRAMRADKDLKDFIAMHMRDAASRNAHRRGLVLRHPDLAAKLTAQPLNYERPDQWTGYIPPSTTATGALNTTPVRPALLALVHEAEKRAGDVHPARHTKAKETAA